MTGVVATKYENGRSGFFPDMETSAGKLDLPFHIEHRRGEDKMTDLKTSPLVWVRDNADNMFLCPLDKLQDPNSLSDEEKKNCLHDASALASRETVPSNKPEGKVHFAESKSPN